MTHKSWDEIWKMNVVEFLNTICYIKDKVEYDKELMEQWRRTH